MDEKRLDDAIDVLTQRIIDTDGWVSAKKISALARLIESRNNMQIAQRMGINHHQLERR